jgi:hypothetical protein
MLGSYLHPTFSTFLPKPSGTSASCTSSLSVCYCCLANVPVLT